MTEQDQSLVDVLKWAVNPSLPMPAPTDLNHDRLLELAQYHRILGPLIQRLDTARPAWFPVRLLTHLRLSQHRIWRHTQERLDATREITAAMLAAGHHAPIIIKGFAAHALTHHPDLLHISGDIDPFAEDLPAFWDVTHTLGYTGKRKDTHEWAKLTRGGVTLDVHQHYPVNAYPADVRSASDEEMLPSRHPGHWRLPQRSLDLLPDDILIRWPDLAGHAMPGNAPGTEGLLFPSPAMMCLIHCTHCFRSSVTRLHFMTPIGGFRLFELLSIHHLAQSPQFSRTEFRALVEHFSAQDAVHFVDNLMQTLLGAKLLENTSVAPRFPEHLPYGGWVITQKADDFLLKREFDLIFQQLGAVPLATQASIAGKDLPRLLLYGLEAHPPLNVSVEWDAVKEILQVCWESLPIQGVRQEFLIHFGHDAAVRMQQAADGSLEAILQKPDYLRSAPSPSAVWQSGATDTLYVTCQVPIVPGSDPKRLHVFLAMRQVSASEDQTEAACYLPLILQS